MIQITLIQIDDYGPWTVTPEPKREADLQILQSTIYRELLELFSLKKAIVFPLRFDILIAITNGLNENDHLRILNTINLRYPVTISMAVALGKTPYDAQKVATDMLAENGAEKQKGTLKIKDIGGDLVQIAHIDIDNITKHTKEDIYTSYERIIAVQNELIQKLRKEGALVFFMGGDNFISVSNELDKQHLDKTFDEITDGLDIGLKAGIGVAKNAEDAIRLASLGLKDIRNKLEDRIVVKYE